MGIPSKQIGQSAESNLLWQISKQLQQLAKTMILPTTTSTTTLLPITASLFFGSTQSEACGYTNYAGTGVVNGSTLCDSSYMSSAEFSYTIPGPGNYYIRDSNSDQVRLFTFNGSYTLTAIGPCEVCP
jgi:hypothetical protein